METGRIGKVHTTMGLTRWLAGAGIDPSWFYALPRRGKARHRNGGDLRTHGLDGRSPAAGENRAATLNPAEGRESDGDEKDGARSPASATLRGKGTAATFRLSPSLLVVSSKCLGTAKPAAGAVPRRAAVPRHLVLVKG